MNVKIMFLTRGFDVVAWLCRAHTQQRKREGWTVKDQKKAPHQLTCDDSHKGPCS